MSGALYNLAAMTVASTGTGTITLGSAAKINGVQYLSFASAGVPDGQPVYYSINDPGGSGASEIGIGTYTSSGTTLTRSVITSTNSNSAINMSASAIVRISPPTSQFRDVLTGNRTYYVRTDGSNSNTGLANTSSGAFLTIQKAMDVIAALDINIYNVTVNVADGTYTGATSVLGPWLGSGSVTIVGNTTTPANVIINPAGLACFTATGGAFFIVSGMELRGAQGLVAQRGSRIYGTTSLRFGAATNYQVWANGGQIILFNDYAVVGAAQVHVLCDSGGQISATGITVTITGTPAFSISYANAGAVGSSILYFSNTFSGSATGTRFIVQQGALINSNGGGASYFPGNAAGSGTNFGASPWGLYQ